MNFKHAKIILLGIDHELCKLGAFSTRLKEHLDFHDRPFDDEEVRFRAELIARELETDMEISALIDTYSYKTKAEFGKIEWIVRAKDAVSGEYSGTLASGRLHPKREPKELASAIFKKAFSAQVKAKAEEFAKSKEGERSYQAQCEAIGRKAIEGVNGVKLIVKGQSMRWGTALDNEIAHEYKALNPGCSLGRAQVFSNEVSFTSVSCPADVANKILKLLMNGE